MNCSEFSFNFLEFVDDHGYALSLEKVDKVFVRVDGFLPNKFFGEEISMGWDSGCFSLNSFILSVVVKGSVCVVQDVTVCFAQLIMGFIFSSQGVPRMTFLFPQLMIWNRTLWMMPLIQMNMVVINLMIPAFL